MAFEISDEMLPVILPVVVYWTASGIYEMMMAMGPVKRHRLFTSDEEDAKNLVSRHHVISRVVLQQSIQMVLATLVFRGASGGKEETAAVPASPTSSLLPLGRQVMVAMLFMDAWQYFWHRVNHMNRFLYKHIHSVHHRLIVPYAYGAQYIHPLDALLGENVGGLLATLISGMSPRTSAFFFSIITIKGVDDHCGLWFPNHPFHRFLTNNAAFHSLHHQHEGFKHNFSAYFFSTWDKILGTYMPYAVDERKGGEGYQLRAVKNKF